VLCAALAFAAGCGSGSQHAKATTTRATKGPTTCRLSAKQRLAIARSHRMIVRMHQLEAPLKQTVHAVGPKALELELNRFLLTVGVLPVDERALLIRKAKSAVGLCEDCFQALEASEPAIETRLGGSPCKPGP
jgi:hypothetical protein